MDRALARAAKSRLCGGLLLLAPCLPATAMEWGFDATAGTGFNDNASNAIETEDRKADGFVAANFAAVLHRQLADLTGASVGAIVEADSWFRFQGLNDVAAGMRAGIRHKFGVGADVPWVSASVRALHRDYHYDYRDGWQYDATVTSGMALTDRLDASVLVQYDRYDADKHQPGVLSGVSTAAYDVWGWTFGGHADWQLTEADTLSFSAARRHGTVTAVTPPNLEVLEYSSAVARDPVFSGNPIAYRVKVDADTWSAAWTHALGHYASVSLAYALRRSRGDEDPGSYTANLVNLTVSYSR